MAPADGATSLEAVRVRRARQGDVKAFESLYRAHVGRIHGLCLRMVADPARAEDLTQEAFVRAWQKLDRLGDDGGFAPWLRRLTVNLVLGDLRSRGRRQDREVPEADLPEAASHPAPLGTALDLERALARVPARARAVFVLYEIEGYSHGEIAELLGLAEGTSKAQLHRARKLLREVLTS